MASLAVADIYVVRLPLNGPVTSWELPISDLAQPVLWLRHQCANRENVQEERIVLFNLSASFDRAAILSPKFLSALPTNIAELQYEDPDLVGHIVPGGVWLNNHPSTDDVATLTTLSGSIPPRLQLLAIVADNQVYSNEPPPNYSDMKVSVNHITIDVSNMAISKLECLNTSNKQDPHTARVLGLSKLQDISSPTTPDLINFQQTPTTPNIIALTELSCNAYDPNENFVAPPEYISALDSKAGDHLESQLPEGHDSFAIKVLQLKSAPFTSFSTPNKKLVSLPITPPYSIFRDDDLQTLNTQLAANGAVCIVGELGLGKTSLATQYGFKNQDQYDWVFFISVVTMHEGIEGFREVLKATSGKDSSEQTAKKGTNVRKAALEWLNDHSNYLLIIDNADSLDLMKMLFEHSELKLGGDVIITSRDFGVAEWAKQWLFGGDKDVHTIPISFWTRLDTINYLKARVPFIDNLLNRPGEREHLNDICENYLKDYPIIVEQFASLLMQSGRLTSLKNIASRLGWDSLLGTVGNGKLDSFAELFKFSLETLAAKEPVGPVAILLICIIGTFGEAPLPSSVFRHTFDNLMVKLSTSKYSKVSFKSCLLSLQSLAFLKTTSETEDICIHSAFHQVSFKVGWKVLEDNCSIIQDVELTGDDILDICWTATIKLIPAEAVYTTSFFPADITNVSTLMTPHLMHLSRFEHKVWPYIACLERVGWIQYMAFNMHLSKAIFERALEICHNLLGTRDAFETASIKLALGALLISLGDLKAADILQHQAFEMQERLCGTRYAEPLIFTYGVMAHLKRTQKCYPEVVRFCEEGLNVIRHVQGTLKTDAAQYLQMVMAEALIAQHKLDGVLEILQEALDTCLSLGDERSALGVRLYIAQHQLKSYQFETAIEMYGNIREESIKLYGGEKFLTPVKSLHGLGVSYHQFGEYFKAKSYFEDHLDVLWAIYGTLKTERIANAICDLGVCLVDLGQYDTAIEKFHLMASLLAEMGHKSSLDVVRCKSSEAHAQAEKGDFEKALLLVEDSISINSEVSGDEVDLAYLSCLNLRGRIKRLCGDLEGAKGDIELCLAKSIEFFGKRDDPNVAGTIVEMGCLLREERKLDMAVSLMKEAKDIYARTLKKKEFLVNVNAGYELGLVFKKLGDFHSAKLLLEESLELMYKIFGQEYQHPLMLKIHNQLLALIKES
ncbi:hypothetical protein HDV05_004140 [Chytridiales sp. JEL 0842]|nr:hypothetical protein HDV05_004140 [Chytridiales sp. JEL 0842]